MKRLKPKLKENPMEASNIKAMREALENIAEYAKAAACHTLASTIISDAYGHDRTEKDACLIAAAP